MDAVIRLNAALSDRYAIEREIGAGGMATVYLARDLRHNRRVALKVLNAELGAVLGKERFLTEIETTANLQHPHLLPLFDSGEADGLLFYVMPYVEGESLRARLERERQLPVDEAVRIATAVASALDYAHERGVIHRDLKPENILLQAGQPVVADFGIALAVSKAGGARITQTGLSLGTPQYMSPEQATSDRVLDARTDIYSLGAVLYEMLAGEAPHTGATAQAVIAKLLTEPPRPVRLARPNVPAHVEAAILQSLEKLPADRFASAGEFADALSGRTVIRARRDDARGQLRTAFRGWRGVAIGTVTLALAAGLGYGIGSARRPGSELPTDWEGHLLGGPLIADQARASPDGRNVAFRAMVEDQMQAAVLNVTSGDWTVLTHDRTRGMVANSSWSRDGTRIYFDRYLEQPMGVYSVSERGGEERFHLANAGAPEMLPDGSLLVYAVNADRQIQLFRFWPDIDSLLPLPALGSTRQGDAFFYYRVLSGGTEAVFFGRPAADSLAAEHLYIIELASGRVRRIAPTQTLDVGLAGGFPLAVTPDGRWVLFNQPAGNLYRIVAVAADGSARTRVVMTLTAQPVWIDVGPDGSLYLNQVQNRWYVQRYWPASGRLDRQQLPGRPLSTAIPGPDGRFVIALESIGRTRVMTVGPDGRTAPLVDTNEETTGPLTTLGPDRIALLLGSPPDRVVAVVAAASGRIVGRIAGVPTRDLRSLAGSPDGATLYYVREGGGARGEVRAAPVSGGPSSTIRPGDAVPVDPDGRSLVIAVRERGAVKLIRHRLDDGSEETLPFDSYLRPTADAVSPNAIGPDGRIVVRVNAPHSWFWPAVIHDPRTGAVVDTIPPGFEMDVVGPGYAPDGSVVTIATRIESTLWRFRPADRPAALARRPRQRN